MDARRGWPRHVAALIVLAFVSLCMATLLWAPDVPRIWPYPHEDPRGTTGPMLIWMVVVASWGISIGYRCSDATVRRHLGLVSNMLVVWPIIALVKYSAQSDVVVALCWYLFYIPLIFSALLLLLAALHTAGLEGSSWFKPLRGTLCVLGLALLALILTNDLHNLAFVFDRSDPGWDINYSYGPVYWACFTWILMLSGAYFAIVLMRSHVRLHAKLAFVASIAVFVAFYCLLYALRVDVAFNTNFALTFSLLETVVIETSLELGLLPSYFHIGELFRKLPLNLCLITFEGEVALASAGATPPPSELVHRLLGHRPRRGEWLEVRTSEVRTSEESGLKHEVLGLHGGMALSTKDISVLEKQRRILEQGKEDLRQRNLILERSQAMGEHLWQQRMEQELLDDVEETLLSTTRLISSILDHLPTDTDERSRQSRRHQLMLVKLLVGYCKRKGALVLSKDDPDFDRERLALVINETASDMRAAGIDCATMVEVSHALPPSVISVLYDCIFDFVTTAFLSQDSTLMIFLHDIGDDGCKLRIAMQGAQDENLADAELTDSLKTLLKSRGVEFSLQAERESLHLEATVMPLKARLP